uniref:Uncharacterized protein n=1 Tax=Fagus sylvatica TaxID=28930 RepID=A0A2N9HF24_FAGSY
MLPRCRRGSACRAVRVGAVRRWLAAVRAGGFSPSR